MKADDRDIGWVYSGRQQERLDRLGVRPRHQGFGLFQHPRPCRPVLDCSRLFQRPAQQRTLGFTVGTIEARPQPTDLAPVGVDESCIDAVERGAAHQPDGGNTPHPVPLG